SSRWANLAENEAFRERVRANTRLAWEVLAFSAPGLSSDHPPSLLLVLRRLRLGGHLELRLHHSIRSVHHDRLRIQLTSCFMGGLDRLLLRLRLGDAAGLTLHLPVFTGLVDVQSFRFLGHAEGS